MNLLIPYVPQPGDHVDPDFREFTYGDCDQRAQKLKNDLKRGDYVFFHTTIKSKKFITSYFVVDRALNTVDACKDIAIRVKYKNPHIRDCIEGTRPIKGQYDVVLFGDPIRSYVFDRPLLFNRELASKLSLKIKFYGKRTETQIIGSATRTWRKLTDKDIKILIEAVTSGKKLCNFNPCRSTEEVSQTLEKEIEDYIAISPGIIGTGLKLKGRQIPVPSGRIDLLLCDDNGNQTVVEVKLGRIGRDALSQIKRYIQDMRQTSNKTSGVIVCEGVLPAYEDVLRKQKNVRIMVYGWNLIVQSWGLF